MLTKIALALAVVSASAFSAYAQSPRAMNAHANANAMSTAVFYDGKKVGQDPDANVRRQLLRNASTEY